MSPTSPRPSKPAGVCTLEEAILFAVHDLREKGRTEATFPQIREHSAVADWLEEHGTNLPIYGVLADLRNRGVLLHRDGTSWRNPSTWRLGA